MKINKNGLDLIKKWEGCRLTAYKDGGGVWTIGWGHTSRAGAPKVTPGMKITQKEADAILKKDLGQYETAVDDAVFASLSADQFSALVSWCYNVGIGAMRKSTLIKKLNLGNYQAVPNELKKWNKDNGKVVKGLVNRRADEAALWERGSYAALQTPLTKSNTALTHAGTGVVGLGVTADQAVELSDKLQQASPHLSAGDFVGLAIGLAIVGLAIYGLYVRWKDGQNGKGAE